MPGVKLSIVAGSYICENALIILLVNEAGEVDKAVRQLIRIGLDKVEACIPAGGAFAVPVVTSAPESITTAGLAEALAIHPDAIVLNVRGAGEFAESHVNGAKNVAYTRLASRLDEVPVGKRLFVHCGSGLRASFATSYLAGKNREVVYVDGPFGEIPASIRS
jgi:hydroxyacylglutathione hydrolase